MILRNEETENAIIEKVTIEGYISQFSPDVRDIFFAAYGPHLQSLPKEFLDSSMSKFLERLLGLHNARAQKIILMRFGIKTGSPMSLEEIAAELGITRERVRMIESRFLRKTRPLKRSKSPLDYYK